MSIAGGNGQSQDQNFEKTKTLFENYETFIRDIISKQDPLNAEDLFQDFFLFITSKPIPDYIENIKGYLFRALTHDILDFFRQNTSYQARLRRYSSRLRARMKNNDPQETVILNDTTQYIFTLADQKLPPHLSRVFHLCFKEECTIQEISEKIGCPPRVVSVYLSNGLKQIRKHLKVHKGKKPSLQEYSSLKTEEASR